MYDFILPQLRAVGVDSIYLEVISTNTPAIKVYSEIGFEPQRVLKCYQGEVLVSDNKTQVEIKELATYDWQLLKTFWDFTPTSQNSVRVMDNGLNINYSLGAYSQEALVGYLIFNPQNNRISQIGVSKTLRKTGIGSALLNKVVKAYGEKLSVVNVDEKAVDTNLFLSSKGLKNHIDQLEMKLMI